jgi:serine/threonine protein kinase
MGTPFFMAPEQARADANEIDARTDLFAVGATLFTLISGQYLHTGQEARQVVMQAATQQARSLSTVAPTTPQGIVDLVAKAVAFESASRWESAEAMQDAVRELHEASFGPIGFEALAALVLVREFRRKSHTKLTSAQHVQSWAANHFDASPLSTTLPAVAAVTRSRDSVGPARDSSPRGETPSSRISAGPSELAGWTGQVRASVAPRSGTVNRPESRGAAALAKSRVLRLGALAGMLIFAVIFGISRKQTQPHPAAAKLPAHSEIAPPKAVLVQLLEPTPDLTNALLSATPPEGGRPRSPAASTLKTTALAKPPRQAPSAKPPAQELAASVERLNVAPTLIRADHSAR